MNDFTPTVIATAAANSVTVSVEGRTKTDKTDKTDGLSNGDFLRAAFGDVAADARPVIVSFRGNPTTAPQKVWFGDAWSGNAVALSPDRNNYFSLATFRPAPDGSYRRRKAQFAALHCIVLDDVGSKVPAERVTLSPSWRLETSPDNFQLGYLLDAPLADAALADRLMNAIICAGLCDAGASGPTARLMRLPVGVNGKYQPPFDCHLVEFDPLRRYSPEQIADGLQLDMQDVGRPRRQNSAPSAAPEDGDPVHIARPGENPVLAALRSRGQYKAPLGGGKHDITCPWVDEHTGAVDGGTAYFEPDDNWPLGGFKCLHGHCAERHIRDLLRVLEVDVAVARMKPTIRLAAGELHRVVDAAERELARGGQHYQRGGLIVSVLTDPGTHETRVQQVTQPALLRSLAAAATWERFDFRSKDWTRTDPPARHVAVLYDAAAFPHLPVLNGLARQPYLRPDGGLATAAGYDAASGMFGVFNSRTFTVPETPSRDDATAALAVLQALLAEFAFASEIDRAAALVALLTAAIRPSLAVAPMFHVAAHATGSGKSYLCDLIAAFATPQRGMPSAFPGNDEECSKLLLAALLTAPAVIEFDNLTTDLLPHKSLCTAITSEFLSGRILGVSRTATVSTRALFLSSGNNVGPVRDMTRRVVSIRLAPEVEIPAARTFKRPDLVSEVRRDRARYVSAALTVVVAWLAADRPKTTCRGLSGFEQWSDLCRQPLIWLGLPDPAASVFEAMAADPDRELLGRLLRVWHEVFDRRPTLIRDAVSRIHDFSPADGGAREELHELLTDIAGERGEINRRRLGWWLKRQSGRIVDGLRFTSEHGVRCERWKVESVPSVLSVLSVLSRPPTETVIEAEEDL